MSTPTHRTIPPSLFFVASGLLTAACAASDADPAPAGTSTGGSPTMASSGDGADSGSEVSGADTGSSGSDGSGSTGSALEVEAGEDTTVVAFEGAHVFFTGRQNMRELDVDVEFPAAELAYTSAMLTLGLSCPEGSCDWWDRKGSLGIVENAGTEDERVLEIARFVTPYRVGGTWQLDVTALRPLLSGTRTLRVYIDTWVGPGHANGNGWLVDAQFDLVGGIPPELAVDVLPLWPLSEVTVGDPGAPIAEQLAAAEADIPATASRVELWSVITGHGQGNLDNCAEFCPLLHGYDLGVTSAQQTIWRDDCADNPVSNQQGTWSLPRAGWCPGDIVVPWVEDLTAGVVPGESVSVLYDVQGYENTCRPDAPVCMGCSLGTSCEYDGGNHTPPTILMSAALVVYQATEARR